jgi:hypothetical protein
MASPEQPVSETPAPRGLWARILRGARARYKEWLLLTAICFVTLLALEGVALWVNGSVGYSEPFFVRLDAAAEQSEHIEPVLEFPFIDPFLGWNFAPGQPGVGGSRNYAGFIVLGDGTRAEALRIVALGGSTTEGSHPGYHGNWPLILQESLEADGIPTTIYNGGVGGYNSSQDLLKMVRDVVSLRPHLVISYGGVNETGWAPPGHPMVNKHQAYLMNVLAEMGHTRWMPNTAMMVRRAMGAHAVVGVEYGVPTKHSRAQQWMRNIRMMKAICDEFGIHFLAVLQPTQAAVAGSFTAEFFDEARALADTSPFVANFFGILDGKTGVYLDENHLLPAGNVIVSRVLRAELKARDMMKPKVVIAGPSAVR